MSDSSSRSDGELLSMTLGEVIRSAIRPRDGADPDTWVDPKSPRCPVGYRQVLAAAQRGELEVFRVGRKCLVRKSELDRWIGLPDHLVRGRSDTNGGGGSAEPTAADLVLQRNGWKPIPDDG